MFLRGNDILNIQQFNLSALPMPPDAYSEPFYISKMKLLSKRDCFMFDRVLNKRLTLEGIEFTFHSYHCEFQLLFDQFSRDLKSNILQNSVKLLELGLEHRLNITIFHRFDLVSRALYEKILKGLNAF